MNNNLEKATSQSYNHKILHKVGKHWEVISLTCLALLGLSATVTTSHADTLTSPKARSVKTITNQANNLHQRLVTKAELTNSKSNPDSNNYLSQVATHPWQDSHAGMQLKGTRQYNQVHANYYSDGQHGKGNGDLLEFSGHGELKQPYLQINRVPKSVHNKTNQNWRLKVDHGIYMTNAKNRFKGTDYSPRYLNFKSMDLSGLSTKGVKSFHEMFANYNDLDDHGNDYSNDKKPMTNDELHNLNISNFNLRSSKTEPYELFDGANVSNLVLGKNVKFTLSSDGAHSVITPSDTSLRTITVPSHYKLFYGSDAQGTSIIQESDNPFNYTGRASRYYKIFNQKKQTIDPKTHKSFAKEILKGTEPAGTYTAVRTDLFNKDKQNVHAKQLYYYRHSNYYMNHMTTKLIKRLNGIYYMTKTYNPSEQTTIMSYPHNPFKKSNPFRQGLKDGIGDSDVDGYSAYQADSDNPVWNFISLDKIHNQKYVFGWLITSSNNANTYHRLYRTIKQVNQQIYKHGKHSIRPYIYRNHHRAFINLNGFSLFHSKHTKTYKNGFADAERALVVKRAMNNKQYRNGWIHGFKYEYRYTFEHCHPTHFYKKATYMIRHNRRFHNGVYFDFQGYGSDMLTEKLALRSTKSVKFGDLFKLNRIRHQAN